MSTVQYETTHAKTRRCWFPGWSYNATPGSRTQFSVAATDTIKNGHVFCFDPEAYTDEASLPSGMRIKGQGDARYVRNVTKPATGILNLFAGVVVDLPAEGLRPDLEYGNGGYKGGAWLTLAYEAEAVKSLVLGDMSSAGYGTILAPVDAQWYLGITALGTNGANLPLVCAHPLIKTNVAAAAVHPVCLPGKFAS